jgi:hypothetical protein
MPLNLINRQQQNPKNLKAKNNAVDCPDIDFLCLDTGNFFRME